MGTPIYKTSEYVVWGSKSPVVVTSRIVQEQNSPAVDLTKYYTKTNLQNSGQSSVHFKNISKAFHNQMLGIQGGSQELNIDNTEYVIYETTIRKGVRFNQLVIDYTLTPTGFSGIEGIDWVNKKATPLNPEYFHLNYTDYHKVTRWNFKDSLEEQEDGSIHLVGDQNTPGTSMYYGTDDQGVKGFHNLSQSISLWKLEETDITPVHPIHSILVPTNSFIKFGDSTYSISRNEDGGIWLTVKNNPVLRLYASNTALSLYFDNTGRAISYPGSKWVLEPAQNGNGSIGLDMEIRSGAGITKHGNLYLLSRISSAAAGDYYLGTGTTGLLPPKTSELNVVYYDPNTGKLSYGTP